MRINLNCPYADKDCVKSLGARWDSVRKVWFLIDPPDLLSFLQWLPPGYDDHLMTPEQKSHMKSILAE